MSVFDTFFDKLRENNGDYDEDTYNEDDLKNDDELENDYSSRSGSSYGDDDTEPSEDRRRIRFSDRKNDNHSKVTSINRDSGNGVEVCVFKPVTFEDAKSIAETFEAHQAVILNMEGVDIGLARRIIDFCTGACYVNDGNLQKISNYIFVMTPKEIPISGDFQEIMNSFDYSDIQPSI